MRLVLDLSDLVTEFETHVSMHCSLLLLLSSITRLSVNVSNHNNELVYIIEVRLVIETTRFESAAFCLILPLIVVRTTTAGTFVLANLHHHDPDISHLNKSSTGHSR